MPNRKGIWRLPLCCRTVGTSVEGSRATTAAFFDLDKTIISRSSTLAFAPSFYRLGLITRIHLLRGACAQLSFRFTGAGHSQMERVQRPGQRPVLWLACRQGSADCVRQPDSDHRPFRLRRGARTAGAPPTRRPRRRYRQYFRSGDRRADRRDARCLRSDSHPARDRRRAGTTAPSIFMHMARPRPIMSANLQFSAVTSSATVTPTATQ